MDKKNTKSPRVDLLTESSVQRPRLSPRKLSRKALEVTNEAQKLLKMKSAKLSVAIVIKPGDVLNDGSNSKRTHQLKLIVEDEDLTNSQPSITSQLNENEIKLMDFVINKVKNNQDRPILQKQFGSNKISNVENMIEDGSSNENIYEELRVKTQDNILANQDDYLKHMKKFNFHSTPIIESSDYQLIEEERIANSMKSDKKIQKRKSKEKIENQETVFNTPLKKRKKKETNSPVISISKLDKKDDNIMHCHNIKFVQNTQNPNESSISQSYLSLSSSPDSDRGSTTTLSKAVQQNFDETVQNNDLKAFTSVIDIHAALQKNWVNSNHTAISDDFSHEGIRYTDDEGSVKNSTQTEENKDINKDDSDKNHDPCNLSGEEYKKSPMQNMKRSMADDFIYSPNFAFGQELTYDYDHSTMLSDGMLEEIYSPKMIRRKKQDELNDSGQDSVKNNEPCQGKFRTHLKDVKKLNQLESNPSKNRIIRKSFNVKNKSLVSRMSSDEDLNHASDVSSVEKKPKIKKLTYIPIKKKRVPFHRKTFQMIKMKGKERKGFKVTEQLEETTSNLLSQNDQMEMCNFDPNEQMQNEEPHEKIATKLDVLCCRDLHPKNVLRECDVSNEYFGIKDISVDYTRLLSRTLVGDAVRFQAILKERVKCIKDFVLTVQPDDIVKSFIKKLCTDEFIKGNCNNGTSCSYIHKLPRNWCNELKDEHTWLIANILLKSCVNPSVDMCATILYWFGPKRDAFKVLWISEYIINNDCVSNFKNVWRVVIKSLMFCGLEEWEAVSWLLIYHCTENNTEKAKKIILGTNMLNRSYDNFWLSVRPLTQLGIKLPLRVIQKVLEEVCAHTKNEVFMTFPKHSVSEINDEVNCLSQEDVSKLDTLIASFRRIHNRYFPVTPKGGLKNANEAPNYKKITSNSFTTEEIPSKNRCPSLEDTPRVMECGKILASIERALNVENVASIAQTIIKYSQIEEYQEFMIQTLSNLIPQHIAFFTAIFQQINQDYDGKKGTEILARLCVTQIMRLAEKQLWKPAYDFLLLIRENHVNPIISKPVGYVCSQVKIAIACSEINYHTKHYNSAIEVLINNNLLTDDTSKWRIEGSSADFKLILKHVSFLFTNLMDIIDVAKPFFSKIIEIQNSLITPIDLEDYYEPLLCNMLQKSDKYKDQIIPLYTQVNSVDSTIVLTGLTYRALLVLSYQMKNHKFSKEMVNKAIQRYVYYSFDKEDNAVFISTCMLQEEIEVYLIEWLRWYYSKKNSSSPKCELKIKFQISETIDYIENKDLAVPSVILYSDYYLSTALIRVKNILENLADTSSFNLCIKTKNKTLIIPPASFKILIKAARKAY